MVRCHHLLRIGPVVDAAATEERPVLGFGAGVDVPVWASRFNRRLGSPLDP